METKNYTQVLIDGKIYTLGGNEDEAYLQRTASYVNEKNMQLRGIPGFSKQSADYQQVMIQLNIADDYFKALDHSEQMEEERNRMEKESYSLKHELVSIQMKLEAVLKDLEETASHLAKLERENRNLTRQNERLSQERAEAVTEAEQMKALMLHQENELRAVGEAAASEAEPVFEEKPVLEEEPEVGKETGEETAEEEAAEVSNEEAEVSEPAAAPEEEVRPVSDEELARRALQAARKAGFHRGRR